MGDVVNLNKFRKKKAREEQAKQAEVNRARMQDASWTLDLRAGVSPADQRWSLEVWARNVTDTRTSSVLFQIPLRSGATVVDWDFYDGDGLNTAGFARAVSELPGKAVVVLNFPSNPTTQCVDLAFFERLVGLAREHGIYVVHDLAYADIVFDGYKAPSILQVPGAKDVAVEFFTMSKSYNMAGWRIGYMVGNPDLVAALGRIKSYHDYGTFTPLQVASIVALEGPQDCVEDIRSTYQRRRDVMVKGLCEAGWEVENPKAAMYVWAKIPEAYADMGSLDFSKKLLADAKLAAAPGVGFGQYGDSHVRLALIENEARIRQAIRGIKDMFRKDGVLKSGGVAGKDSARAA